MHRAMRSIKKAITRRLWFINSFVYKSFGRKALLYKPVTVKGKKYISIGAGCNIAEGARIEAISQWGDEQRFEPSIEIGENTTFENFVQLTAAGKLTIGHDCVFSSRVFITTAEHDYSVIDKKVMQQKLNVKDVEIGNYCFLGMDVKVFPGVKIGDNVIVGANAIVMNDLPPYTVCIGAPAKVIKKFNFESKEWERI